MLLYLHSSLEGLYAASVSTLLKEVKFGHLLLPSPAPLVEG